MEQKIERSLLGKIIKWMFIGFNILMLYWAVSSMFLASDHISEASSEAGKTGAAIGTGLAGMFIVFIWGFGSVILGLLTLLTRPKN